MSSYHDKSKLGSSEMSDSEYSSSSDEEVRPTPLKITKGKKAKVKEVMESIVEKEKEKRKVQQAKTKDKKIDIKVPIVEEVKPDPRDLELLTLKQSLEELKAKLNTPAPQPVIVEERKPKRTKKVKEEVVEELPPAKLKKTITPRAVIEEPKPLRLSRDDILRSILFS